MEFIKSILFRVGSYVISYSAEQIKRAMHLIADKLLYGDLSVRREILRELVKEIIIDRVDDRLRAAITIVVSDFGIDKRETNGGNDDTNRRSTSKSSRWPLKKPEDGNNSARPSSSMRKSRTPVVHRGRRSN